MSLATKKWNKTCLRSGTMMLFVIWILKFAAGKSSSTAGEWAAVIRRSWFSDKALCVAPVFSKADFSSWVNCKGTYSILLFSRSQSVAMRGRTSVIGGLGFRRGFVFASVELSARLFWDWATNEASVSAWERLTVSLLCLVFTWGASGPVALEPFLKFQFCCFSLSIFRVMV